MDSHCFTEWGSYREINVENEAQLSVCCFVLLFHCIALMPFQGQHQVKLLVYKLLWIRAMQLLSGQGSQAPGHMLCGLHVTPHQAGPPHHHTAEWVPLQLHCSQWHNWRAGGYSSHSRHWLGWWAGWRKAGAASSHTFTFTITGGTRSHHFTIFILPWAPSCVFTLTIPVPPPPPTHTHQADASTPHTVTRSFNIWTVLKCQELLQLNTSKIKQWW